MPRLARLRPIPFGWYYVAMRSAIGRHIVTNQDDLIAVHKVLRRTLREKHARLHAGYVSEREAHLVLQAGEAPLSAITGRFQHEYARIFNASHGEHGSLFRLHYRSLLFQHQHWLVPLTHFVHWLRRIEGRDAASDGLWWSTDAVYRGKATENWVTTSVMLRMLTRGAYKRSLQEEAYRKLMDNLPDPSHVKLFRRGSVQDPRVVGDKEFIADAWRMTGTRARTRQRKSSDFEEDIGRTILQIIRQFNALCASRLRPKHAAAWIRVLTFENLRSGSRKRPLPMVRALSVSYLAKRGIATVADSARYLGRGTRALSAQRRRQYEDLFRRWFRAEPDVLFGALPGDHGAGGPERQENLYAAARIPRGRSML
jgi:hypothetical protein